MEEFKKAIKLDPGDCKVHNRLGSVYGNMGRYDEAMSEFKKALEINPHYGEAKDNYDKLVEFLGRK